VTDAKAAVSRSATLGDQTFTVVADRLGISEFWDHATSGKWEDDTLSFVQRHVRPSCTFVDIGAWIGPVSLSASRRAARVLSLEPDPVAHADLVRNAALNASSGAPIDVWHVGVDNSAGELVLFAPGGLGGSITSSIATPGSVEIRVPTVTFDQIDARLGGATSVVVKVDIEGHEYQVIDRLAAFVSRHRAPLHLSLHPRAYFEARRREVGYFAAKLATWQATRDLLGKLERIAPVMTAGTLVPFTAWSLTKLIFLRRRAKNFTIEIAP
jgi:FkbM family methyltransferase